MEECKCNTSPKQGPRKNATITDQCLSPAQHCSAIQLSFALLISCLIFLLTSLYFAAPSGSHFLLFNSLLLSQRSRMSVVTHGFFVRRCFPRISWAVSVTILLKVLVSKFTSVYLSSSMISGVIQLEQEQQQEGLSNSERPDISEERDNYHYPRQIREMPDRRTADPQSMDRILLIIVQPQHQRRPSSTKLYTYY